MSPCRPLQPSIPSQEDESIDRMRFSSAALVDIVPDSPTRPTKRARQPSRIFEAGDAQGTDKTQKESEPKPSLFSSMRRPSSLRLSRDHRYVPDESVFMLGWVEEIQAKEEWGKSSYYLSIFTSDPLLTKISCPSKCSCLRYLMLSLRSHCSSLSLR